MRTEKKAMGNLTVKNQFGQKVLIESVKVRVCGVGEWMQFRGEDMFQFWEKAKTEAVKKINLAKRNTDAASLDIE